jgi:hypothetical protein
MPKVNIYVPDELKARMDRAGERNWSAAAQRAFEVECNLAEVMMTTEDTVVARLRTSKTKEDEAERVSGRMGGQTWARDWAEYGALQRVATDGDAVEDTETLACMLFDVDDPRDLIWDDVNELWERLRGRRGEPPTSWIKGFVGGATEVWDEVADKI